VLYHQELSERIIGLAIEVHWHNGPGLLESFYARRAVPGVGACRHSGDGARSVSRRCTGSEPLQPGFRADILAEETVILEIKAVPTLLPAHDMQLQTYLRLSGFPVGLCSTSMHFV
jgi:GxxExxY protein